MGLAERVSTVRTTIQDHAEARKFPEPASVLWVTKYARYDQIQALLDVGETQFGENKVQDTIQKAEHFSHTNAQWQLIGHLQRNKVNKAVGLYDCIQSVDSEKLLSAINHAAEQKGICQDILIQINLSGNPSQHGCPPEETRLLFEKNLLFSNVKIKGIMVIAPHTSDSNALAQFFQEARQLFDDLKKEWPEITCLSMGMSNDYALAIDKGSTMVRVGRLVLDDD